MGSLMTSMWAGVSGLNVNQVGLNTTGHNLTNVDTVGFTRQQVVTSDFCYQNVGQTRYNTMQVGLGTSMTAVRQVRNIFLDQSYRFEVGRQGFYESQFDAVLEMEELFGELEGEQFQEELMELRNSIDELSKEPDNLVKKSLLVNSCYSFLERATKIYDQVKTYQNSQNEKIIKQVNRINEIGEEIRALNKKIQRYEADGVQNANDYRDTRNNLLDELAGLVKISYREELSGAVTVRIENVPFIDENYLNKMTTEPVSDTSTMLKVKWQGRDYGDVFDLESSYSMADKTDIGSLKGLLLARGDFVAKYSDIPKEPVKPIKPVASDFTSTADYTNALNKYNLDMAQYEADMVTFERDKKQYNQTVGSSIIMTMQAQFDQLVHGITTTINDILSPNAGYKDYLDHLGYDSATATNVSISGVNPADLSDVLLWDEGTAPVGKDGIGREAIFNRKGAERYKEATMTFEQGGITHTKTVYIYQKEDPNNTSSLFTLGELEVNPKLLIDPSLLPVNGSSGNGSADAFDFKIGEKLLKAWDSASSVLDPNVPTPTNFKDYYTAMIGGNANRGRVLKDISENQAEMVLEINTTRLNVSGVSADEEMTNLVKFQHSYNASARYINVIDQMLEHIINRLG